MAVANTKSTLVTKLDTGKGAPLYLSGASPHAAAATLEVAAADDNNSVYRFARVHSSWRVTSIGLYNDAITGGTAFDCGLYASADGAAVDSDLFATAVDLSTARTVPTEILFEALDIAKIDKRIWELLGLAADPQVEYDLCLTGTTVGTGAGTISLAVQWVGQV